MLNENIFRPAPMTQEELVKRLVAYQGRLLVVRSRDFFLAKIENVDCTDGVAISGRFVALLSHKPMLPIDSLRKMMGQEFSYSATWSMISFSRGEMFASYVTWGLLFDETLNREIAERFSAGGRDVDFTEWADRHIHAWLAIR